VYPFLSGWCLAIGLPGWHIRFVAVGYCFFIIGRDSSFPFVRFGDFCVCCCSGLIGCLIVSSIFSLIKPAEKNPSDSLFACFRSFHIRSFFLLQRYDMAKAGWLFMVTFGCFLSFMVISSHIKPYLAHENFQV